MKCPNCEKIWGEEAWPCQVSIVYCREFVPVVGIDEKQENGDIVWKLDHGDKHTTRLKTQKKGYACDYCGEALSQDYLERVVIHGLKG